MSPESWESFFLGQFGATAALAGLLFVAVSINVGRILEVGGLADRGFEVLITLLGILLIAALMLIPQQSPAAMGAEVAIVAAVTLMAGTVIGIRGLRRTERAHRRHFAAGFALFVTVYSLCLAGAGFLLAGNPSGLYWLAAGMCIGIVKAVIDAWVLLVEINR